MAFAQRNEDIEELDKILKAREKAEGLSELKDQGFSEEARRAYLHPRQRKAETKDCKGLCAGPFESPTKPYAWSGWYVFSLWNPDALFDPDKAVRAFKEVQSNEALDQYYNISSDDWHIWEDFVAKYGKLRLKYMPVTYEALLKDPHTDLLKRANDAIVVYSYWTERFEGRGRKLYFESGTWPYNPKSDRVCSDIRNPTGECYIPDWRTPSLINHDKAALAKRRGKEEGQ